MASGVHIAVLGPLAVEDGAGRPVRIAGERVRTLLARLALEPGRSVAADVLIDAVWGDEPPAEATNALQTLISRVRRAVGDSAVIEQAPGGYRLAVPAEAVDAIRFERLAAEGAATLHRGDADHAAEVLGEALALWRGPALAGLSEGRLAPYAVRLEKRHAATVADRIDAELAAERTSDPHALVREVEALQEQRPFDERLAGQLLRALARAGRPAEALAAYEELRRRLADELGVDPSPELRRLHTELLNGDLAPREPATPARPRTNLTTPITTFVGRENEVARIGKALEQNRLVTLVGPGGAGKTRLAGEAARAVLDSSPDGVWLVELARVTSGHDVPQAVLSSLGLRESHLLERRGTLSARDAMTLLVEGLADQQAVVLLDNCEHVIDASARLADHVLTRCPRLRVLATSREPLGIFGEVLLAVPPLDQPAATASAQEALEYPAVRLFADRAAAVRPDFAVTDESVATVVEIVRRLDGLPLAIELAAARLRTLPLDEIAGRLSDRFRLLTGGSRTALPRHRTLRAVVEWSWELLTPVERQTVEELSVFPSGITPISAAAVRGGDVEDTTDVLASLVDKSLLQPLDDVRRTRMLETIREYGTERLAERGVLADVRERHARYFAALVAEATPHLTTAGQLPWFDLLAGERENVLAAMRFLCDVGDAEGALTLAIDFATSAMMLGNHAEISAWMADALAVNDGGDPDLRLIARAMLALNTTANGAAHEDVDRSIRDLGGLARELVDVPVDRWSMLALMRCAVAFFAGDADLAEHFVDETLEQGDPWARAAARMFRANMSENSGDVSGMRADALTALAEFRALGERWGLSSTLRSVGLLHTYDGDLDDAVDAYREALHLAAEFDSREDTEFLLARLADLELRRDDVEEARRYLRQAEARAGDKGSPLESLFTFAMAAAVEREAGDPVRARELHREAMRRVAGMPKEHPLQGHVRAILLAGSLRIAVDDGELATAATVAREAMAAAIGTRDLPIVASVGVALAELAAAGGDHVRAAGLLGAAACVRGADDPTAREIVRLSGVLRAELGTARYAALYAESKALDRDAAIERLAPE